jgi:hypothetical protein
MHRCKNGIGIGIDVKRGIFYPKLYFAVYFFTVSAVLQPHGE